MHGAWFMVVDGKKSLNFLNFEVSEICLKFQNNSKTVASFFILDSVIFIELYRVVVSLCRCLSLITFLSNHVHMMVTVRSSSPYVCYLLVSLTSRRTYVGITNNLQRRLRQHNGEITGGAKATRMGRPHYCRVTVGGFTNQHECLQFEYMWKHIAPRKSHGEKARICKLMALLQKDRWTQNAPLASTIPLVVSVYPPPRQEQPDKNDHDKSQNAVVAQEFEEMHQALPNYIKIIIHHIQAQEQPGQDDDDDDNNDKEEEQEVEDTTSQDDDDEEEATST
jgi:predicted GIY-YIG superfamily endonuclease